MTPQRPPVTDWATDFDHTDPTWVANPYPIWDDLRERCPMTRSGRFGMGTWLPTSHEYVSEVAYDTDRFTSRSVVVFDGIPQAQAPVGGAPPITSDPPFHHEARRLLLPAFSPKAIDRWAPYTRDLCRELAEKVAANGAGDAAKDFAQHIPVSVIARMMGFPLEDADRFRHWIHIVIEDVGASEEDRMREFAQLDAYIDAQIKQHAELGADAPDDITTYLLNVEMNGAKLTHEHVRGTLILILVAGIDTTWSAIGASLWHLAQHDEDRRRLAAAVRDGDDAFVTMAIEEFLRAYAPVTMARVVAKDCEFHGQDLKEGEWLLLPFPAANRDPQVFERADEVLLDRAENRHAAFGLGIHRCLGSNLARMELRTAVEEWLKAVPEFGLSDPSAVTWSKGQVRGPRSIPVTVA